MKRGTGDPKRRPGARRAPARGAGALAVLLALGACWAVAPPADAQSTLASELKRPRTAGTVCDELRAGSPTPAPSAADRAAAADLLARADEAALLGESAEAIELLRGAARLDPVSAEIAYRLARGLEDALDPEAATSEYCRFLALEPTGTQAEDALERLGALTEGAPASVDGRAEARFTAGVELAQAGDLARAEEAFSDALEVASDWPAAWYNRALVRAAASDPVGARADLIRYLELRPGASDAAPVERRIASARAPEPAAAAVPAAPSFAANAILPGLGQFRSGRWLLGGAALGAAAGAVALGVLSEREVVRCIEVPVGGQCPEGQVAATETERPYLAIGLGAAVLVSLLGALEQQLWYSGSVSAIDRVGAGVAGDGVRVEVGPAVGDGREGVDLSLVRLRF